MVFKETKIKNISEVTEPLKEQILKGDLHTIDEIRAWLQVFRYSDVIIDATINAILCEFVMSKVSCDEMSNMNMIVETSKLTTNHYATYKNFLSGGSWGFFCGGA